MPPNRRVFLPGCLMGMFACVLLVLFLLFFIAHMLSII